MHTRKTLVGGHLGMIMRTVAACRPWLSLVGSAAAAGGLALAGYPAWPIRRRVPQADLVKRRRDREEQSLQDDRERNIRLIERLKGKYDRYTTSEKKEPPVLDILII